MGLDLRDVLPGGDSTIDKGLEGLGIRTEGWEGSLLDPFDVMGGNDPLNLRGVDHTDYSHSERLAEVSRGQYEDYLERFAPLEEDYIARISDPNYVKRGVDRAGMRADDASRSAAATTERDMSRYNVNVTPEQRKAIDRVRKLGFSKNRAGAMNRARDTYSDMQLGGMQTISGYGRGMASRSTSMFGDIADTATAREAANQQARSQQTANRAQGLASLLMFL